MLLFSRVLTLTGNPRVTMPWAMEITAYVNSKTTAPLSCWSASFGYPVGTVGWSMGVESQTQLAAEFAAMAGDDAYFDLIEKAADWVDTPGEDLLRNLIYGTPGDAAEPGAIATVTTATAAVDRMGDAIGWSVEIAQHVESVTGSPVFVFTDMFGQMGKITWIGIQADAAAVDAGQAKMDADTSYLGRMAATKETFIPGSGHTSQMVRIA